MCQAEIQEFLERNSKRKFTSAQLEVAVGRNRDTVNRSLRQMERYREIMVDRSELLSHKPVRANKYSLGNIGCEEN